MDGRKTPLPEMGGEPAKNSVIAALALVVMA